ncbi:hypothetical protein Poras_1399 [Porphyromonas asaccharolytica DSM 20707]|uniref:Uncharacterized protein n=1 Tax=Porphyromonas asaccharolytica (strain ATCC 25260 / DSM 20707 / BCRC 10618 / CCUG 7834 / JCM 6326 / LMG 13178 / VPI 4198 / B440) TaxID=879243 RepID=F4KMV5_PORAD|nr:hypothetical protein Poras_1399 [Porphyromonas asaccharolytica DSM 20707]
MNRSLMNKDLHSPAFIWASVPVDKKERFLTYFRYDMPVIPKGVTSLAREPVTQRVVSQK